MTLASNTRLGPYEILAPIGSGGMGEVYRARDTRLGREVAIKVMPTDVAGDPDRVRRFQQEAQAASALNHPNILTVHDVGVDQGVAYLVTELLRGEALRDAMARGALSPERAAAIATQIARGLAAAHDAGIVHRDLKPENLFVTQDGTCKILDFGLARVDRPELVQSGTATPTAGATLAGTVMGTAGYMAPEQVRGDRADARSDLFSLGIVLYEMLAGTNPFQRDTVVESMSAILKEEAPAIVPSTALAPVIRRCLEKNPSQRFQSASDLAFAIENSSGIGSIAVASAPRSRLVIVLPVIALAIIAGVFFLTRERGKPTSSSGTVAAPVRSIAVVPFQSLSGKSDDEYFTAGMTDALTTELSHIAALKVLGSHSAARFKDSTGAPAVIAKELGVEGLVSGSVLRDGDRVRISARLSEAATDRVLWAENYERPVSDVLALQGEVTRAIAKAIALELSPAEKSRLSGKTSVDPGALDEYLKGRYLWSQRTEPSLRKALDHFRESARIAPDFALAYSGIADSYLMLAAYGYVQPLQSVPLALEALTHATDLDSTLGEAHATRGDLAFHFERNNELSLRESDRAIALSPGYAPAHIWRAEVLAVLGRKDEAIAESERAITLDPGTPFPHFFVAWLRELKGDVAQAEADYQAARKMSPGFPMGHLYTDFLIRRGRHAEALTVAENMVTADPIATNIAFLADAQALCGRREDALASAARLRAMAAERWITPLLFAQIDAALGNRDDALRHLREAIDARDFTMPSMSLDSGAPFDAFKDDAEFQRLIALIRQPAPAP